MEQATRMIESCLYRQSRIRPGAAASPHAGRAAPGATPRRSAPGRRRLAGALAAAVAWSALGVAVSLPGTASAAAINFSEPFTETTLLHPADWSLSYAETADYVMQNNANSPPCLTARALADPAITLGAGAISGCVGLGSPDAPGSGALRLIRDLAATDKTQAAAMIYRIPQSTADGLDITFKIALWDQTSAADGLVFFLKDGADTNDAPGAPGGSMGYAPDATINGVSGGLVGIAFDKWGNYAVGNPSCAGETGIRTEDSITVRGAGTGKTGYCRIGVSTNYSYFTGTTRAEAARQVRITVEPATEPTPKIRIYYGAVGATLTTPVLEIDQPAELKAASSFKFGFGAASGYFKINAAVWDLGIVPADLAVPVTVTAASPAAIAYPTPVPAIGYTTNPATTATDWTAEPTCAVYATTDTTFATPLSGAQGAGTYVTHCTGGTSNAYNPTAYVDGTLVIEKPPVVVSAATPVPTLSEWGLLLLSLLLGLTTLWRTRKCPG